MSFPTQVTDFRSNSSDQIAHAASILLKSPSRKRVFSAIYAGKQKVKTVSYLMRTTKMSRVRVLQEGAKLANNGIVSALKVDGETAYQKDRFYSTNRTKILALASAKSRFEKYPTKVRPRIRTAGIERLELPRRLIQTRRITIEDIDSFSRVRKPGANKPPPTYPISESRFKRGIQQILGEPGQFKDWGGELNDLLSTRLRIRGKRVGAAFGFKGPGQGGVLTQRKMGKNADQIQRLFISQADAYIVQYWSQVHESVYNLMHELAKAKSVSEGRKIMYGVIDGQDTQAIMRAYPEAFAE